MALLLHDGIRDRRARLVVLRGEAHARGVGVGAPLGEHHMLGREHVRRARARTSSRSQVPTEKSRRGRGAGAGAKEAAHAIVTGVLFGSWSERGQVHRYHV